MGRILLAGLLLAFALPAACSDPDGDWTLARDRDGIRVYTRPRPGSHYKEVRALMTLDATLASAVALIRDTRACASWVDLCRHSRVVKQVTATDRYLYQLNNLPWPAADRDIVARIRWTQDKQSLAVTMSAQAVNRTDLVPLRDGVVRITRATTRWVLTPLANGRLEVITQAHVDPGSPLPAWLVNWLLVNVPYKTLQGMRQMLASGDYDKVPVTFIKLPDAPTR